MSMLSRLLSNQKVRNTVVYTIGQMAAQALPFIMLPILTHYLLPAEYGSLATYNIMVNILAILCGLRAYVLVTANYFQLPKTQLIDFMGEVWFGFLWTTLLTVILAMVGFFIFKAYFAFVGFWWLLVGIVIAGSQFWIQTLLAIWRCEERPMPYVLFSFFLAAAQFVVVLLFVVGLKWGWHGRVIGQLVPVLCLAVFAFLLILRKFPFAFSPSWRGQKEFLHFCLPLVPYQLSSWLTGAADQMILAVTMGLAVTGIYMSGYQIMSAISILANIINLVWGATILKFLASDSCGQMMDKVKMVQSTYVVMVIFLFIGLLYAVCAYFGVIYLLPVKYSDSKSIIFPLSIGFIASGWYYLFVNYLFHFKRTYLIATLGILTSCIKVALTWALVLSIGMVGAAWAIAVTNILVVIIMWVASHRLFPMPWKRVLLGNVHKVS